MGGANGAGSVLLAFPTVDAAMRVTRSMVANGFASTLALTAEVALAAASTSRFDMVLVAREVVDRHGPSIIEALHEATGTPPVVVDAPNGDTANGDTANGDGANGAVATIAASMRGGLRRTSSLVWGPLRMDVDRRLAWWYGRSLPLTVKQFRLLRALMEARGALLSHDALHREVFGDVFLGDRDRLFAHVRRIRHLFEPDSAHPVFLLTVRGEGFRLADPDAIPPPPADLERRGDERRRSSIGPNPVVGERRQTERRARSH